MAKARLFDMTVLRRGEATTAPSQAAATVHWNMAAADLLYHLSLLLAALMALFLHPKVLREVAEELLHRLDVL